MSGLLRSDESVYKVRGYLHLRCLKFHSIFLDPASNFSLNLQDLYSGSEGYHVPVRGPTASDLLIIECVEKLVPVSTSNPRVLDIGCASGNFLVETERRGWEAWGLDLNPDDLEVATLRGLKHLHLGDLQSAEFSPGLFDWIHLGDVIEHVANPSELIKEVKRVLRPGGIVTIATPNVGGLFARATFLGRSVFGIPSAVLIPPAHVTNFSSDGLKFFLAAHGLNIRTASSGGGDFYYYRGAAFGHMAAEQGRLSIGWKIYVAIVYRLLWGFAALFQILLPLPLAGVQLMFITVAQQQAEQKAAAEARGA